ncbi:hypothetical protein MNBD_CHLOROFLEXI01-5398 [hydrothermal vent metagenome]|uniref:Uncharacterized protein n=1 Tax=hydrothermal vent metagenome TaxID=652676 RepID=A0A3B0VWB1_9ZZZZ
MGIPNLTLFAKFKRTSSLGLFIGAFVGAVIGLVAVDYSYVILRKLDDFIFLIALLGSEERVYSIIIIWWMGAILGSFLGIILATILDIDERREVVFMMLFGTFGALICSVIAISAAWKVELMAIVHSPPSKISISVKRQVLAMEELSCLAAVGQ